MGNDIYKIMYSLNAELSGWTVLFPTADNGFNLRAVADPFASGIF